MKSQTIEPAELADNLQQVSQLHGQSRIFAQIQYLSFSFPFVVLANRVWYFTVVLVNLLDPRSLVLSHGYHPFSCVQFKSVSGKGPQTVLYYEGRV